MQNYRQVQQPKERNFMEKTEEIGRVVLKSPLEKSSGSG